jgi:hypothetical protein
MKNKLFEKNLLFVLFIFFLSCSAKDTVHKEDIQFNCTEFYSDGKLKSHGDTINGKYEGLYKEFFPDGKIKYINFYKKGLLNGPVREYFANGNPKLDMYYFMGKPQGVQYVFFESDSAKVKNKFIVSRHKNKEVLVSRIEFDERGDTIWDEGRVKVMLMKNTFQVGDSVSMKMQLNYPEFKYYRVHIGNFDRMLNLVDSNGYQTYEGQGNVAHVDFLLTKKGSTTLRGYIEDFEIEQVYEDSSYTTIGTLNNWFDVEIVGK